MYYPNKPSGKALGTDNVLPNIPLLFWNSQKQIPDQLTLPLTTLDVFTIAFVSH